MRRIAMIVVASAMLAATFVGLLSSAAVATPVDCVFQPQPPRGACYEPVWVDGDEVIMNFPQHAALVHHLKAKQQPFYVVGPQTDTPQGPTPGFFHDHVIETSPSEGGFTPFMHGYLVICSPEGISSGACIFNMETPPGGVPIPLTQSVPGYDLTTAEGIQAAANAGLVVLLDTRAVFIATVGPSS